VKLLAFFYMVAGAVTAILLLKVFRRDWADFGMPALTAAGLNAVVGLIAYLVFRRPNRELHFDRALLILGYAVGVVGGAYFFLT